MGVAPGRRQILVRPLLAIGAPGFENPIVWQRARKMCTDILPILDAASARRDYRFLQELNEAASSFAANIAEGHLRGTKRPVRPFPADCGGVER